MLNHIFFPLNETLEPDKSLASYTSWHIGGNAEFFCQPKTVESLAAILKDLPDTLPITFIGLGSNLLIRDGGVRGLVLHTKCLNKIEYSDPYVYVEAGVPCAKLAKFSCQHDLKGGEFFAGIPGTVGGALAMNAGAFGGETWDHVFEVLTLDRRGNFHRRTRENYDIAYRLVKPHFDNQEWFVGAYFKFSYQKGRGAASLEKVKALLKKRNVTQPIGTFNCGSVFKNPENHHAAQMIEACGLKGFSIGGAIISEKHANFIINRDNATSADVEALISMIQKKVAERFSIKLEPEVRMIGQPGSVL